MVDAPPPPSKAAPGKLKKAKSGKGNVNGSSLKPA